MHVCAAGVSQPYVSRYLKGDFTSMSERSCRSIKKWYLAYRKNPMAVSKSNLVFRILSYLHRLYSVLAVAAKQVHQPDSDDDFVGRQLSLGKPLVHSFLALIRFHFSSSCQCCNIAWHRCWWQLRCRRRRRYADVEAVHIA